MLTSKGKIMSQDPLESFSRSYLRLARNSPCILVTLKINKKILITIKADTPWIWCYLRYFSRLGFYPLFLSLSFSGILKISHFFASLHQLRPIWINDWILPKGWRICDFQMDSDNSILSTLLSPSISPFVFDY